GRESHARRMSTPAGSRAALTVSIEFTRQQQSGIRPSSKQMVVILNHKVLTRRVRGTRVPGHHKGGGIMRQTFARVTLFAAAGVFHGGVLADVRLTNDFPGGGYVSVYTLATGNAYSDATLAECSRSRGRQNEPAVSVNPRNINVIIGSSNDYCGVYNDGNDANGAPIPSGPVWLGYYRSQDGGRSFQ